MLVRREVVADLAAIAAVHRLAFAGSGQGAQPPEVDLVAQLRSDGGWRPSLSLVAADANSGEGANSAEEGNGVDGHPRIVGHVVCTVGAVGSVDVLGLGPLGVLPERQGQGIGNALVHAVLGAADALDYPAVVLLGDPGYYSRFGFVAADSIGITATQAWGASFQARRLSAWSTSVMGEFRYPPPFYEL